MIALPSRGSRDLKIFCASSLATAVPLLVYLVRYPTAAPICLFAGDAFYYLDIVKNSAGKRGFSFDGVHQTNGFHPLWEYLLSFCHHLGMFSFGAPFRALISIYLLNLLLLAVGGAFFSVVAARLLRLPWLAVGVAAPGFLWFLLAIGNPDLTSWSFLNGMESALTLFCAGAALLVGWSGPPSWWRDVLFSVLLGCTALARLDEIFLLIAFAASALLLERLSGFRLLARFAPALLLIVAYLLYNERTVHVLLPTSGSLKAGLGLVENVKSVLKQFLPVVTGDKPGMLTGGQGFDGFAAIYVRIAQMVLPAVICGAEMVAIVRAKTSKLQPVVFALCGGVVLKAAYNFILVRPFYQGEWYYAVSFAIANVVLALWIERFLLVLRKGLSPGRTGARTRSAGFAYVLLMLFSFNVFVSYRNYNCPTGLFRDIQDGAAIRARLVAAGYTSFVEFDDGGLGYALNLPSTAGFGLALDPEALRAMREGNFFALMQRRDVRLILATDTYAAQLDRYLAQADETKGLPFGELKASEFQRYKVTRLSSDAYHAIGFYTFAPRDAR